MTLRSSRQESSTVPTNIYWFGLDLVRLELYWLALPIRDGPPPFERRFKQQQLYCSFGAFSRPEILHFAFSTFNFPRAVRHISQQEYIIKESLLQLKHVLQWRSFARVKNSPPFHPTLICKIHIGLAWNCIQMIYTSKTVPLSSKRGKNLPLHILIRRIFAPRNFAFCILHFAFCI